MTRRTILPLAAYTAEVSVVAWAAVWLAWLLMPSQAVSIATGITAAWLAGMFLPCPCHRRGRR